MTKVKLRSKIKIIGVCIVVFFFVIFFYKGKEISGKNISKEKLADYDLILSAGQSFQSKLVSIFNFSLMDYTHIGIIHRENNQIFVLHSTPDGTKKNSIRYDDLDTFLKLSSVSKITVLRIIGMSDNDKNNLEKEFLKYKSINLPFDYDFNNFEHKKIYCAELVFLIYTKAKLFNINDFNLSEPIQPKYFLKLNSLFEIDCKKPCL